MAQNCASLLSLRNKSRGRQLSHVKRKGRCRNFETSLNFSYAHALVPRPDEELKQLQTMKVPQRSQALNSILGFHVSHYIPNNMV